MLTTSEIAALTDDEFDKIVNKRMARHIVKSIALRVAVPVLAVIVVEAIVKKIETNKVEEA